jgi:hypothetical protein
LGWIAQPERSTFGHGCNLFQLSRRTAERKD